MDAGTSDLLKKDCDCVEKWLLRLLNPCWQRDEVLIKDRQGIVVVINSVCYCVKSKGG